MSARELAAMIGREGSLRANGLAVDVRVLDVKTGYGMTRYLVTPIAGHGAEWVDSTRVTLATVETLTRVPASGLPRWSCPNGHGQQIGPYCIECAAVEPRGKC